MALNDFKNGVNFTALSATTAHFTLLGGRYGWSVNATWSAGSVTIQIEMPDGVTFINAAAAFSADATSILDLPAGTYRIAIATASAVQGALVPIAYRELV